MSVLEFCQTRKMKVFYLRVNKEIINGKEKKMISKDKENGLITGYQNKTINELEEYNKKRLRISDPNKIVNTVSHDTTKYHVIDVDNKELYKKYFGHIDLSQTPQYKSMKSRYPHYFVNIVNIPENANINLCTKVKENDKGICDILMGQWAWFRPNEQMINASNPIVEIDYKELFKIITDNEIADKSTLAKIKVSLGEGPETVSEKKITCKSKPITKRKIEEEVKEVKEVVKPKKQVKPTKKVKTIDDEDSDDEEDEFMKEILDHLPKTIFRKDKLLLDMLPKSIADDYDLWVNVGLIIRGMYSAESKEGLKRFYMFSNQSKKCNPSNIENEYKGFKPRGVINLGSANKYLEDASKKLHKIYEDVCECFKMEDNHKFLAEYIYKLYGKDYVCAYFEPKNVYYHYESGVWTEMNGTVVIESLVDKLAEKIKLMIGKIKCVKKLYELKYRNANFELGLNDEIKEYYLDEYEFYSTLITHMKNIYEKLAHGGIQGLIYKKIRKLFYVHKFEDKLNKNIDIIGFGEHVYDLKAQKFRLAKKEDYISLKCGYTKEIIENAPLEPINKFLTSVFPDKEQREYMLNILSDILCGKSTQKFNVWSGLGGNGKSKLQDLLRLCFGEYFATIGKNFITTHKDNISAANPQLYHARYARCLFFNEPDEGDYLNNSVMKILAGDEMINVRDLFKSSISFKPQFSIFILCNTSFKLKNASVDDSIPRRLIFNKFTQSFVKKPNKNNPNHHPEDPIMDDENYMILMSQGLMKILLERWNYVSNTYEGRKYPDTAMSLIHKQEFINLGDEFPAFFEENYTITGKTTGKDKDYVELKNILSEYQTYCYNNGHTPSSRDVLRSKIIKLIDGKGKFIERTNIQENGKPVTKRDIFIGVKSGGEIPTQVDEEEKEEIEVIEIIEDVIDCENGNIFD